MIQLDPSVLAQDIAMLLQLRGAAVPPLQWHTKPTRVAKQTLEGITDNAKLFRRDKLADEGMAVAVRAMLYLWNGWPKECAGLARDIPKPEQDYLLGVCDRQASRPTEAKVHFQQVPAHPIYEPIAAFAIETVGSGGGSLLQRFRGILQLDGRWETCAFVDLCEQHMAGKLDPIGERLVCTLQCREFEQLLIHCYEKATGSPLPKKVDETIDRAAVIRMREKREAGQRQADRARSKTPMPKPESKKPEPKKDASPPGIAILCPKCKTRIALPTSARGSKHKCAKCSAAFIVPQEKQSGRSNMPPNSFGIKCPKCASVLTVSQDARGKKERCRKCGAVFLIPRGKVPQPAK